MMDFNTFYNSLLPIEKPIIDFFRNYLDLKRPKSVLEVGSGWGLFTRCVAELTTAEHITVDKTGGYGLKDFLRNTEGFEQRFTRLEEDSHKLLPGKELEWNKKFDLIYVDGDHTQDGAAKDLRDVWPLLAPGGSILIDDVFHKCNWDPDPANPSGFNFGVARALWGFLQAHSHEFAVPPQIISVGHGLVVIKRT